MLWDTYHSRTHIELSARNMGNSNLSAALLFAHSRPPTKLPPDN
jgi:hypothetical protein